MKHFLTIAFACLAILAVGQVYTVTKGDAVVKGTSFTSVPPSGEITSGLILWLKFNGNANDDSGSGYNVTEIGGASYTTGQDGQANHALNCTGSTAVSNATVSVNYSAGTVTWWQYNIHAHNEGVQNSVFIKNSPTLAPELSFQLFTDGNIYAGFNDIGGDTRIVLTASASNWPQNTWTFYCLRWNGSVIELWVNGSMVGSRSDNVVLNPPAPLNVGRFDIPGFGQQYFSGRIDDYRIYNRALSDGEIGTLYSNGAK